MEILDAYDLTRSFHAAAELAGCDPKTVARYVALRNGGRIRSRARRGSRASTRIWRRSRSWSSGPGAGSGRTWCTRRSRRWGLPGRSAPAGGRWPGRRARMRRAACVRTGHGTLLQTKGRIDRPSRRPGHPAVRDDVLTISIAPFATRSWLVRLIRLRTDMPALRL